MLLGLFTNQESQSFGEWSNCTHRLNTCWPTVPFTGLLLRYWRITWFVCKAGPSHSVLGQINLKAELREDCKSEDPVDAGTRKPKGVHANELEGILNTRLDCDKSGTTFKVKLATGVQKSPPLASSQSSSLFPSQ